MKSTMLSNNIIVSDLFKGTYDHEKRLAEQEILHERLKEHLNDPVVAELAASLKEMTNNKIASIVHIESIIDKLKKHGMEII